MHQSEQTGKKFVVGLGNPGRRYAKTRHNLGFRVLGELREMWQVNTVRQAFSGELCRANPPSDRKAGLEVLMLAPQTYMNRSGQAVREMMSFYKAPAADVLLVLDDAALPLGRVRARAGGSGGGHNGLADVIEALGTQDVPRIRIGIGPAPAEMDLTDFVLTRFGADEQQAIQSAVKTAAKAVEDWVFNGITYVMDTYNRSSTEDVK